MKVFVSYARRDQTLVRELAADLERLRQEVWIDAELEGGQEWWEVILEQIRACDVFVVALSDGWLRSSPCRGEFEYAVALERPVLPLSVSELDPGLLPERLARTEFIDYRRRTPEAAMDVSTALSTIAPRPLPDPLPPTPPAPVSSLGALADRARSASLGADEQIAVLTALRREAEQGDRSDTVRSVVTLLRQRSDITVEAARQSDALISRLVDRSNPDDVEASATSLRGTPQGLDLARSLATHLDKGRCTPILGLGIADGLLGSRRALARTWAQSFEYPGDPAQRDDLPQVAQFVSVMLDRETLRESLVEYLGDRLRRRYGDALAAPSNASLDTVLLAAWRLRTEQDPNDPHLVLARTPCPLYLTAHPAPLLEEALRVAGKDPVTEVCRWRDDLDGWPPSAFGPESTYTPSVDRPLVYHLFGTLDVPDSLVLTEDDYFDFLIGITQNKALVPDPVRSALADSALLLLGFGLDDWDTRVLLRSLVSQEGSRKLRRYKHVAAQIDASSSTTQPERARRYLETYFGKVREPAIDIYWGTVADFCADLVAVGTERRGDR